jgi:hypothetical protein
MLWQGVFCPNLGALRKRRLKPGLRQSLDQSPNLEWIRLKAKRVAERARKVALRKNPMSARKRSQKFTLKV